MAEKMQEIKRIDPKEFREEGYLQEVNRQFLHPLGLALEVNIDDETGETTLGGIWDFREDPEGIWFGEIEGERKEEFRKRTRAVEQEQYSRRGPREEALGFFVQPIP